MSYMPKPTTRRCFVCGIRYPPHVTACLACGVETDDPLEGPPDPDWQERADAAKEAREAGSKVAEHRRRLLVQAGVTEAEAELLADLPEVDVHAVVDAIEGGCPPDTAVKIWS